MRFYGPVGYAETIETKPGIWEEKITERNYYGDVIKLGSRKESREKVNDDILINEEVSILADPYAYEHFTSIQYIVYLGVKWKVSSITVERPRLTLSLGGLYNGQ